MQVDIRLIKLYGDQAGMQKRVDDFRKALRDHAKTVDIAAPTEDQTIEFLARGNHTIEPFDPDPLPPPPPPLPPLADRVEKAAKEDPMWNAVLEAVANKIGVAPAVFIADIKSRVKELPQVDMPVTKAKV